MLTRPDRASVAAEHCCVDHECFRRRNCPCQRWHGEETQRKPDIAVAAVVAAAIPVHVPELLEVKLRHRSDEGIEVVMRRLDGANGGNGGVAGHIGVNGSIRLRCHGPYRTG